MKVRINVDKVEALKAGLDRHGLVVVDVPASSLSPEQGFATLARLFRGLALQVVG